MKQPTRTRKNLEKRIELLEIVIEKLEIEIEDLKREVARLRRPIYPAPMPHPRPYVPDVGPEPWYPNPYRDLYPRGRNKTMKMESK